MNTNDTNRRAPAQEGRAADGLLMYAHRVLNDLRTADIEGGKGYKCHEALKAGIAWIDRAISLLQGEPQRVLGPTSKR